MPNGTILLVDDDPLARCALTERLRADGHEVIEAENAAAARGKLSSGVDLVLLDCPLPNGECAAIISELREVDSSTPVVLLAEGPRLDAAAERMKLGAYHCVRKPLNVDDVAATVESALETVRLRREVRELRAGSVNPHSLYDIVGASAAVTTLRHTVARAAAAPGTNVLLIGESGTGKDFVARIIHHASERASHSFVGVSCSPSEELANEIFGHEHPGAAGRRLPKRGLLESADGGTVFLDEVGDLSPAVQGKLLRFLEHRTFTRIQGETDIHVDVRVVAATTRDLDQDAAQGRFNPDLLRQLESLRIPVPPLRTHIEDVPLLVECFIDAFNTDCHKRVLGASPEAYTVLQRYGWPGNVRELRNVVERAMLLSGGERLEAHDFAALASNGSDDDFELPVKGVDLEQLERSLVIQALRRCAGNQTRAAGMLGLNRDQIRYRIEKFGLTPAATR